MNRPLAAIFTVFSLLAASAHPARADTVPALLPEGYSVETFPMPANGVEVGVIGLDVDQGDDSVWLSTRAGDVWKIPHGEKRAPWTLFAEGLNGPGGLLLERKDGRETGTVFVGQRQELTELKDTDGDGRADAFRRVGVPGDVSGNNCEYNHGLVRDDQGNFYGSLNLSWGGDRAPGGLRLTRVGKAIMAGSLGAFRGTFYRMTPAGKFEVLAWGLRSPCGVGRMADGKLLVSDNQGDWMPSSFLTVVQPGAFYGHPAGLLDHPQWKGKNMNAVPEATFAKMRAMPSVWIPYGELANSPGQPVEDATGGKFGPFAGQIFMGDQTRSNLMRCTLQQVKGQWQGFCIDFIDHFQCGIVRGAFDAKGRLYLGQTSRGWPSKGAASFGLERVVWDGKTIPFCIKDIRHEKGGFRVLFTRPIDAKTASSQSVKANHWTYHFWARYGSPKVGEKNSPAADLAVADDGLSLFFKTELVKTHVYDIQLPAIRSQDGKPLSVNHGYYTLNETLD